jgi:hypothetical protein
MTMVDMQWEYCSMERGVVIFMSDTLIQCNAPATVWYDLGLARWELAGVDNGLGAPCFYFKRLVMPGRSIDNVVAKWP